MTRRAVSRCVAVCVLCVGSLFAFADEAGGGKGERGSFTLTFSNRAEQSTNQYIAQRMGWPLLAEESAKVDYNLPDESFEVYVPADYTGDKPYGLLVFCMLALGQVTNEGRERWLRKLADRRNGELHGNLGAIRTHC